MVNFEPDKEIEKDIAFYSFCLKLICKGLFYWISLKVLFLLVKRLR